MNTISTPKKNNGKKIEWTQQDDAEYNRLAVEMNEDIRFQFTLFTFGVTTTAAVLSLIVSAAIRNTANTQSVLPYGIYFLVPFVVLLPTSMMILNRARTRNRKASYIMVTLEYKRLRAEGINDKTSLDDVKKYPYLPWETALHIIERTNLERGSRVHLAPALLYMFISYFAIEMLCIALAVLTSIHSSQPVLYWLSGFFFIVLILVYVFRISALRRLTSTNSIQGYVENWLKYKYGDIDKSPRYLKEWINKHYKNKPLGKLRIN